MWLAEIVSSGAVQQAMETLSQAQRSLQQRPLMAQVAQVKVQEAMMIEMTEKATRRQTEVQYLTKSCQDLVDGIAAKQREVDKLQHMIELQANQLQRDARENQNLLQMKAEADGEAERVKSEMKTLQSEVDRTQNVIKQHQMGFEKLQQEMQRSLPDDKTSSALEEQVRKLQQELNEKTFSPAAMREMEQELVIQHQRQMQAEIERVEARYRRQLDEMQDAHQHEMEQAHATKAHLHGEMAKVDNMQAIIDEKVKDRVALKQHEQRRLYDQQLEQQERARRKEVQEMQKECDEALWNLERQHQQELQKLTQQTAAQPQQVPPQKHQQQLRSPDAPEFLRESAEARRQKKQHTAPSKDADWLLGLEEWQVVAAQKMAKVTTNTVQKNVDRFPPPAP